MPNDYIEDEVVVRPIHGMQLSEGYIRKDNTNGFLGCLPGVVPAAGKTKEEVLGRLEQAAKKYYGDDVIVEVAPRAFVR